MMPRNPRQARRLMEKMGMRVEEMSDVNQVIIKTTTRKIVINGPEVTLTRIQGQDIYQVMGGKVSEVNTTTEDLDVSEEDILLVAQQTSASLEVARKALEEANGNLAQAIILVQRRTG